MNARPSKLLKSTVALIALGAVLAVSGCGGSNSAPTASGDTLNVLRTESFDGWNLDSSGAYATYQTTPAVIESLLRFAPDGKTVQAGLSDDWKYDRDALTWTFKIRDGAKFSDGTPVTSKDVAFSEKVWASGPNFGSSYDAVKSVDTSDPKTAVFRMKEPASVFDSTLAGSVSGIMPANFGGKTKQQYYQNPIGAGPYKVKNWSTGGKITLVANPNFYDSSRPAYKEVDIDVVADENERSLLFQSGEADVVEYVTPSSASSYDEASLKILPPSQINHLSMNTTQGPLKDVKARLAVANAIDYNSIVNGPLKGYAQKSDGILPSTLAGWVPPSKPYFSKDLPLAKKDLAASSSPDGFSTEVIYDSGVEADALQAQIVKSNLAAIGINVKTTGLETGAFIDRAFTLDADMVLWSYGAITPNILDPIGWINGTSWLFTGYDPDGLAKQLADYAAAETRAERDKIVTEIQDESLTDAPAVALAESQAIDALAGGIAGFHPAPWGLYYYDDLSPE